MNGARVGTPARGSRKSPPGPQAPPLLPRPPFPPRPTTAVIHTGGGPGLGGPGRGCGAGPRREDLYAPGPGSAFPMGLGRAEAWPGAHSWSVGFEPARAGKTPRESWAPGCG